LKHPSVVRNIAELDCKTTTIEMLIQIFTDNVGIIKTIIILSGCKIVYIISV
jgi:hypothetical protein